MNDESRLLTPRVPSSRALRSAEETFARAFMGLCLTCDRRADDEDNYCSDCRAKENE